MSSPQELAALAWSYFQAGALESAEELYRQSVAADPQFADGWVFLAIVQKARGDLNGAAESYRKALSQRPDYFEALNNLGNILVAQGKFEDAADFIRSALKIQSNHPLALNNLGACLRHLGKFDEAIACYRQALELKPNYADAHNNLGDALARQGNWADAVASYGRALRLRPDFAEAHNNLGVSLGKLGRTDEAVAEYQEALRLNPHYAEAYLNLGNVQAAAKRTDEAIASYQQALRLNPRLAEAHYNIGVALAEQDKFEEAIAEYQQALELKPSYLDALANLGHALRAQGKLDEALATYDQLVHQSPDSPEAHMSRALVWLLLGDYERGWPEYEWRWKTKEFAAPRPEPRWDGALLDGRTIAITAEQGLGDIVQFVRYAPAVKARGGEVVVTCPRSLITLFSTCPGIDRLVPREELPQADVYASLLSLPAILGTTLATIPNNVPYLAADPELEQKWRLELADLPGFKIGIAWQGNPQFRGDRQRSVPLACFEPLARLNGVRLISLQKGAGTEQLAEVADRFAVIDLGSRLDTGPDAFVDTAAVLKSLDLVITINSSLAHVAGALAVPTWIALGCGSFDWRWLLDRDDSPWYPTVRLFHQQTVGNWTDLMERLAAELARTFGR
jgi:tetratricopeptide (TPR) repeat protein